MNSSSLDINYSALMVIDMQNDFLLDTAPICCPGGLKTIPDIKQLVSYFHQKKRPVIYTKESHRKEKIDFGLELEFEEPEHCIENTPGIEIFFELTPSDNDILIIKRRYSAFFGTDLDIVLRGLNVNTLVLTGVATDVCVRATAQDAHQHNYRVIVPLECVAGTSYEAHHAALKNISYVFGSVVQLNSIISGGTNT